MEDCLFCNIVKGELPTFKIYEDDHYLAFLDISPRTPGHTLVIPKAHFRWVYDVTEFGEYWEVAKKITQAMQKSLSPKYVAYLTFGTEISHAHIHIVPMYEFSEDISERNKYDDDFMNSTAEKIVKAIKKS